MEKAIKTALISVYHKDNLEPIIQLLHQQGVRIYSTGGTLSFIQSLNVPVDAVESLTGYPSIFGGRVKTLHPKIFGGILHRRDHAADIQEATQYEIPGIDLVIVDLYPFEETVAKGASHQEIIEKIDIGGISLIRAAAKNYQDVLIVASRHQYMALENLLLAGNSSNLETRRWFAAQAFGVSSHYDTAIFQYFNGLLPEDQSIHQLRQSIPQGRTLRYGENPHQRGFFYGDLDAMFDQLNGKELSYNNLVDIDGAVGLIDEFPVAEGIACAIIKHTNACGVALGRSTQEAYTRALACDPVSAFGGIIISNHRVDLAAAEAMHSLFFEVLIAPDYAPEAIELLKAKKNRIILRRKPVALPQVLHRTLLNGVIAHDKDHKSETVSDLQVMTKRAPDAAEQQALLFAVKVVKHTKSNAIILSSADQLLASGVGQTSRVDALRQAIQKAAVFGFDLKGAVMASDAFFPFPDCVQIAHEAGITAVIQPGGSINDKDSVAYCDAHDLAMVRTGFRHFRH